VFALGVILHEMTTGRRPFDARDAYVLAASVLNDTVPPVMDQRPDLPVHLDWVIGRCLAKDPARRLAPAARLAEELETLSSAGFVGAKDERSIAVLPFTDLSPERDQEHFCEGIAEVIIHALAQVPGLRVASRTASFQFRGGVMSPRRIGERLGARSLLEGSVLKAGDRLRVTATLTGIEDGYCLWSERFEGRLADIFEIQDRIARRIVEALGAGPAPRADRALARPGTRDPEAYDWYLRGRRFLHQQDRRGIQLARQMFERALALDPAYALGHAGTADCWTYVFNFVERDPAHVRRALEAADRAVELDPTLVQAHLSRALALAIRDQHAEAEREYARALELGPEVFEAHYLFARQCFMRGRTDEAIRHYEEAMRLRPEDYQAPLLVAQIYADLGRAADAEAVRRRGVNLAEERLRHEPDDIRAMYMAANGMVALGEVEPGLEWVSRALALAPEDAMLLYNAACIYSLVGRTEQALDCLEREERTGNIQISWYEHDSNLDPLRADPRFQRLMERKRAAQPA
jgi:TolB-like protein/Tfp pilus assembly protein PilF